jgi:hypothetical protein
MRCKSMVVFLALLIGAFGVATAHASQSLNYKKLTPTAAGRPDWYMLGMDEGGVVSDLQQVYHSSTGEPRHQLWATCMNGGIYRSVWNSTSQSWSQWDYYLLGKKGYGLDVVEKPSTVHTEYVLFATGNLGIWYGELNCDYQNLDYPTTSAQWRRPNGAGYPADWGHTSTQDVAFFWPTSGIGNIDLETQYYVILSGGFTYGTTTWNPGIYMWVYPSFQRVDESSPQATGHAYGHFYRDEADKNVVYVTSAEGIYKLSGPYGRETFEKLPPGTKLEDLPVALPPIAKPPKNLPLSLPKP